MRLGVLCSICALGCVVPVLSQSSPTDEGIATSSVSGHVYCNDTNAPARMATIVLQPADAVDNYRPDSSAQVTTHAEGVQTQLDGSFSIQHVSPGTYYVIASAPGYLSPLAFFSANLGDRLKSQEALKEQIANSLPRVTVKPNTSVSVNATLERGAAVSGTVLYDDGSPASGLSVQALIRRKNQWISLPFTPFDRSIPSAMTDDKGSYRISGLPAREYLVEVQLNLRKFSYESYGNGGNGGSSSGYASMPIYSGGKLRPKVATPFLLGSGEERRGEDIEIPASKFHTVRGGIVSAHDGHVVNGGMLSLLNADDKSVAASASVEKGDESFTFNLISEGNYILRVDYAADNDYVEIPNPPNSSPRTRTEARPLHYYGRTELPIHVDAELSGVMVTVPELSSQPNPSAPTIPRP